MNNAHQPCRPLSRLHTRTPSTHLLCPCDSSSPGRVMPTEEDSFVSSQLRSSSSPMFTTCTGEDELRVISGMWRWVECGRKPRAGAGAGSEAGGGCSSATAGALSALDLHLAWHLLHHQTHPTNAAPCAQAPQRVRLLRLRTACAPPRLVLAPPPGAPGGSLARAPPCPSWRKE